LTAIVVILFIMTPVSTWVARQIKKIQKKLMKIKQDRIKLTNESMHAIKVRGGE
jgi:hypothetical protein